MDYFITNSGLGYLAAGTILNEEMLEILIDTDGADAVCVEKYTKERHTEFCKKLKSQHQKMRFEFIEQNGYDLYKTFVEENEQTFKEEKDELLDWLKYVHRDKRQQYYDFMFENCQ